MTTESGAQEPTIIKLAQIKQWLIPADAESYKTLAKAGAPLTIIHEDMLPTLKLLTDRHNIRGVGVNFREEIMEPFFDQVGRTWQKKAESCVSTIQSKDMVFEVSMKDPKFGKAREAIDKMRDVLYTFFQRWGYRSTFEYSEGRSKGVLNVSFWHDPTKQPVIGLDDTEEKREKVQIVFGNRRFTFKFDPFESKTTRAKQQGHRSPSSDEARVPLDYHIGYVHILIETKKGGEFVPTDSTKCKYSEISNVLPMLSALMSIPQFNPSNFETDSE